MKNSYKIILLMELSKRTPLLFPFLTMKKHFNTLFWDNNKRNQRLFRGRKSIENATSSTKYGWRNK
jgi:hypothetical protein